MKLLFDQNLSSTLVPKLADLFPSSTHVKQLRLTQAEDETIWAYARDHGFTIISKDSDFSATQPLLRRSTQGHLASGWQLFNGTH